MLPEHNNLSPRLLTPILFFQLEFSKQFGAFMNVLSLASVLKIWRIYIPSTAHSAVKEYSIIRNILNSENVGILDEHCIFSLHRPFLENRLRSANLHVFADL